MAVLDTTFLIALERGDTATERIYGALLERSEPVRVPAAVWVEYLAPMVPSDRRRARETLGSAVVFEPFDKERADEAVDLQHELLGDGRRLGWHDLQVAATARSLREPLFSNDVSLSDVPGVETRRHDEEADA